MFTYRDERKLFALITIIIVAALLALVQISAQRSGSESPIATVGMSVATTAQSAVSALSNGTRDAVATVIDLPQLERENARLRERNRTLLEANANLHEMSTADAAQLRTAPVVDLYHGITANVIGFPPENQERIVTIDRGSKAGVVLDDGVVAPRGAVGHIQSVGPYFSTVLLITDYTSRLPAVFRRGHWWGIAQGNLSDVRMQYIPQDAPIKIGEVVVTGEGRSFHAGIPIGVVTKIERNNALLYQTAILKPSVDPGALDRVVVVPK